MNYFVIVHYSEKITCSVMKNCHSSLCLFIHHRQAVEDVIDLHEMGLINPHISALFSMEESAKAIDFMKERKSTGKVVLEIR